jgi:hypothetical protein
VRSQNFQVKTIPAKPLRYLVELMFSGVLTYLKRKKLRGLCMLLLRCIAGHREMNVSPHSISKSLELRRKKQSNDGLHSSGLLWQFCPATSILPS